MSANLPKGTRNIATARRYDVAIQLRVMALMENSLPMEGRATLMEAPVNGVRNAVTTEIIRAVFLNLELSIISKNVVVSKRF